MNGENMLTMEVPKDFNGVKKPEAVDRRSTSGCRQQLAALPGVQSGGTRLDDAAARRRYSCSTSRPRTHPLAPSEPQPQSEYRTANPDYFQASGIPLLKGREFSTTDRRDVAASRDHQQDAGRSSCSRDKDPIGQRIAWTGDVLKFIGMSRTIGARWSASSATRRTAASTRCRCRRRSFRSRRATSRSGGFVIRTKGDRGGTRAGGDADRAIDRARAADREGDDGRADSRRERRAAPAERDARVVVRRARADRRRDRHRRRCSRSR